jgi:predicted GNAT family N-acyltransferase
VQVLIERVAFDSPRGVEALAVRMEVFVREQNVPEEVERDEYDAGAAHFVAIEKGQVIGTARIVRKGNVAKIGRVAVLLEKRMTGVGKKLMLAAIDEARAMGVTEMMLTAQVPVIGFYERLGFVAEGEVFEEAGIPHRTMRKRC